MSRHIYAHLTLAALSLTGAAIFLAAGPLNPPAGPVASTYKTLSEVEPRTAINATNTPGDFNTEFIISAPGSYYLTSPLSSSRQVTLFIGTGNVSVDLGGMTITNTSAALAASAIQASGANITIRGGSVSSANRAIYSGSPNNPITVESVTATGVLIGIYNLGPTTLNGCVISQSGASSSFEGVYLGSNSHLRDCTVLMNPALTSPAANHGILVGDNSIVESCTVSAGGIGIAASDAIIRNCRLQSQNNIGIRITGGLCESNSVAIVSSLGIACSGTEIRANRVTGNISPNAIGIYLIGGNNCISRNTVSNFGGSNGFGIATFSSSNVGANKVMDNELVNNYRHLNITAPYNLIVRNTMSFVGAGGNANLAAGNSFGPFINAGNTDLSTIAGSTHPQANFVY